MPAVRTIDRAHQALANVILSYPTHLADAVLEDGPSIVDGTGEVRKSWTQIAKTGDFVSRRYGKFSITRADLAEMLKNFTEITPKSPTRLPVDYDHLSMDPQKVGDGVAAGWISQLELREEGDQLWGEVEWTPDGATAIEKKHYQYVSPSFVKDYVYKDGNVIGTTLLAAAITNHPFLEGMAALTLSAGLDELATPINAADVVNPGATVTTPPPSGSATMEAGQRVSVKDDEVQKPEQLGIVFEIQQVVGEGADAFVSLLAPDGTIAEWFRADELQPAAAPTAAPMPPQPPHVAANPAAVPAMHARRDPMKTFDLTDVNGNTVTLGEDVLQALGRAVVPEGSVIMASADVTGMKDQITQLSGQVEVLSGAAAAAVKESHQMKLKARLDQMSGKGLILLTERQWAEKTFGAADSLDGFNEWAATKTTPVVKLNTEHGSGLDAVEPVGAEAGQKIHNLAVKIAKDERIPYRDAVIKASKQEGEASQSYRDQFAQTVN